MITKILSTDHDSLEEAAQFLRQGELVAFPTETVYGLGASLFNERAITKIFEVKKRPSTKPLIAHISHIEQAEEIAQLPEEFYQLASAFFPGPLALIVRKKEKVPLVASAGTDTIAIRMPACDTALKLIEKVGPIVAPSANLSGKPSSTESTHVIGDFLGKIAAIVDGGKCFLGIESTLLSLIEVPKVTLLRLGMIKKEAIEEVLKRKIYETLTPKKHSLDQTKWLLFENEGLLQNHIQKAPHLKRKVFTPSESNFYSTLRVAEEEGCEEVIALCSLKDIDSTLKHRLLAYFTISDF